MSRTSPSHVHWVHAPSTHAPTRLQDVYSMEEGAGPFAGLEDDFSGGGAGGDEGEA